MFYNMWLRTAMEEKYFKEDLTMARLPENVKPFYAIIRSSQGPMAVSRFQVIHLTQSIWHHTVQLMRAG